jgi:hypothetical protein
MARTLEFVPMNYEKLGSTKTKKRNEQQGDNPNGGLGLAW